LNHRRMILLSFLAPGILSGQASIAADYPTGPITFIAPFAAGSTTDAAARVLAQHMTKTLGQPAVIDNRVGAGGTIGLTGAFRSKPDGYTLVFTSLSAQIISSFSVPGLPWDPATSFTPIGQIAIVPMAMAVSGTLPISSLRELVAYAKSHPNELTFGTLGSSTAQSLAMATFMKRTGISMREIPYKTSAQIFTDVAAGRVDIVIDNVANILPILQGGRVRPLAVTTGERVSAMKATPTISEAMIPGFAMASWVGLAAPAGTPPGVIATVSAALKKALDSAEYKEWLQSNGALPADHTDPKGFSEFIDSELNLWRSAAALAGVINK